MAELSVASIGDLTKMGEILWQKGYDSVPKVMRTSGLFKTVSIPQGTGDTRDFSEIDGEQYADEKGESDQSERAKVQQGLIFCLSL